MDKRSEEAGRLVDAREPVPAPAPNRKAKSNGGGAPSVDRELSREDILGCRDLQVEAVPVPEWGGTVYVAEMSALRYADFDEVILGDPRFQKAGLIAAFLVAMTACDSKGNRLFTTDDVEALGEKSGDALRRVVMVAKRLNGMEANATEAAAKN